MAKRKTALEHLNCGREPHIVHMIPPGAPGYREADGGAMVVSSPAEVNAMVRTLQPGEIVTLDDLRAAIAICPSLSSMINGRPLPSQTA